MQVKHSIPHSKITARQNESCSQSLPLCGILSIISWAGRKFIIKTDYAPLVWLRDFKEPKELIARWISIIETFDYGLRYIPGREPER